MLDHQLFLVHQPAQAIEVLLKSRAYVVKRLASAEMDSLADQEIRGRLGQVTWSKYGGPSKAWTVAVSRAGFWAPPH